jgi:hypothetical protein
MVKLYPVNWEEPTITEDKQIGRNFEAARQYIADSVPENGIPLTVEQIMQLICGAPLPRLLRTRIGALRKEACQLEERIEDLEPGEERTELETTLGRLENTIQGLLPPHFAEAPQECIRRVLKGLPVISPPEVRAIKKKEAKQLILEEINRRVSLPS